MRSSSPLLLALAALLFLGLGVAGFVFLVPAPEHSPGGSTPNAEKTEAAVAPAPAIADDTTVAPVKPSTASPSTAAVPETGPASGARADNVREEVKVAEIDAKGFAKGRVVDFNGAPAVAAKVFIVGKKGGVSFLGPDTETDVKGEFVVSTDVKKKKTLKLRVSRKDRLPINVDEVVFKPKETFDVGTLQFPPSGSLEVSVTDGDNRPIPNAQVVLEVEKPNKDLDTMLEKDASGERNDQNNGLQFLAEMGKTRRPTNEAGLATFAAVAVGKVTVKVEPPSGDLMGALGGSRRAKVKVRVNGIRSEVSGDVKGEDAAADEESKGSDREPLEGSPPKKVDIALGTQTRLDVALAGLAILTGRATIHGEPVVNEIVGLHETRTSGSFVGKFGFHVRAKTDGDGRFSFPPVPPGSYVVKKGDPGESVNLLGMGGEEGFDAMMGMAEIMMKPNDAADKDLGRQVELLRGANEISIDFGGAALEVFVQDLDSGAAISNATIRLFDYVKPADGVAKTSGMEKLAESFVSSGEKRPVRLRVKSDSRGRAEFKEIQGGSYRITARSEGRPPSLHADFEIVEGQYSRVIVKIARGTSVTGTVNDRSGNAVKNATVSVISDGELEPTFPDEILTMLASKGPSTMSDVKGVFNMEGLAQGQQHLLATAEGFAPAALRVNAPSEGNFFFLEKPGTIRVTVVRDGKPEANANVMLDTGADDAPIPEAAWSNFSMLVQMIGSRMASTNDQGVAILTKVPPGNWNVGVMDYSASTKSADDTQKELQSIQDAAKASVNSNAEPGNVKGSAKSGDSIQDRIETLFKKKSARVRVYAQQEASARLELGK